MHIKKYILIIALTIGLGNSSTQSMEKAAAAAQEIQKPSRYEAVIIRRWMCDHETATAYQQEHTLYIPKDDMVFMRRETQEAKRTTSLFDQPRERGYNK